MAQSKMPRRPAMLDAARADAIIGDEDPAASAAVAHTAAWALMGVGDETFTDADVARLRETVRTSGVDTIAHVWSRSPEFTLPGALWRVYLLHEWYHRDPLLVAERYAEGSRAPIIQGLEAPVELRPLSLIMEEVDSLLRGDLTDDDLDYVLGEASRAMRVLAAGEAGACGSKTPPTRSPTASPCVTPRCWSLPTNSMSPRARRPSAPSTDPAFAASLLISAYPGRPRGRPEPG